MSVQSKVKRKSASVCISLFLRKRIWLKPAQFAHAARFPKFYMARDCRSVAVFVVLWWNSLECFGTLPGNTRPTKTARPTLPDSTLLLLQTINEIDDAEKRMKAIHILLEKVEEEKEKEKEIDILKVEVEKEKVEKEKVEKEKNVLKVEKEKDVFQERLIKLEEDLLRAKGLMTARVVFERVVQLAFNEQKTVGKVKGKCIFANILPTISDNPQAGRFSKLLVSSAKRCDSTQSVKDALQSVWTQLSQQVHDFPWRGDVKIGSDLPEVTRCIAEELCKGMGLEVLP